MEEEVKSKATKVEREKLYTWITNAYKSCGKMTARECAVILWQDGKIPYPERQSTHPRILELCKMGIMEESGESKFDVVTRKNVRVYQLT